MDSGEKYKERLTPTSIRARRADTMSIQVGTVRSFAVIAVAVGVLESA